MINPKAQQKKPKQKCKNKDKQDTKQEAPQFTQEEWKTYEAEWDKIFSNLPYRLIDASQWHYGDDGEDIKIDDDCLSEGYCINGIVKKEDIMVVIIIIVVIYRVNGILNGKKKHGKMYHQ